MHQESEKVAGRHVAQQYWPLIAALALIIAFLMGFYWRSELRAVACTLQPDEHCLRDWLGASSGMIAAIAALATIIVIARQMAQAERHQKETIWIATRDARLRAESVPSYTETLRAMAETVTLNTDQGPKQALYLIEVVKELAANPRLIDLRDNLPVKDRASWEGIGEGLQGLILRLKKGDQDRDLSRSEKESVNVIMNWVMKYCDELIRAANEELAAPSQKN